MVKVKRKKKGDTVFFDVEELETIRKTVSKNVRVLHKRVRGLRKMFMRYEEPYAEIYQNARSFNVKVRLPEVGKNDIELEVGSSKIIVRAESKKLSKVFYRSIDVPPLSDLKRMEADFSRDHLRMSVPYKKEKEISSTLRSTRVV